MTTPERTPSERQARRVGLPRRARRGVVAAYIHEISPRHRTEHATPRLRSQPVAADAAALAACTA